MLAAKLYSNNIVSGSYLKFGLLQILELEEKYKAQEKYFFLINLIDSAVSLLKNLQTNYSKYYNDLKSERPEIKFMVHSYCFQKLPATPN